MRFTILTHVSQHIVKSLTVDNVPYEVFSGFSAMFSQIRKVRDALALPVPATDGDGDQVEVSYFLDNWAEIRSSPAMRNVWQQIRLGRHPGFEEGELNRFLSCGQSP
jgi:hypothetical protein